MRRPLETVLPTISHHGSHLSQLQEVSSECPSSSSASSNNHLMKQEKSENEPIFIKQEKVENEPSYIKKEKVELQPLYNPSQLSTGHKENQNPNSYLLVDKNNACHQQMLSVKDNTKSNQSYAVGNLKLEYNMQNPPRTIDYKNYQMKEAQNMQPSVSQADQISTRQRPIQMGATCFPKLNRVIKVKNSQYLVLGKLGQGMSGEVLWVYDLGTSEARAIKCVNLSKMDKEAAKGCLQEIVMLDKLKAPCIVHMYS